MAPNLDATAPEGVDPSPASRDVEELEMLDPDREGGIDDEMLTDRVEAEHRGNRRRQRVAVEASLTDPTGLFSFDTRFMSKWVLTVGGERLNPLSTMTCTASTRASSSFRALAPFTWTPSSR